MRSFGRSQLPTGIDGQVKVLLHGWIVERLPKASAAIAHYLEPLVPVFGRRSRAECTDIEQFASFAYNGHVLSKVASGMLNMKRRGEAFDLKPGNLCDASVELHDVGLLRYPRTLMTYNVVYSIRREHNVSCLGPRGCSRAVERQTGAKHRSNEPTHLCLDTARLLIGPKTPASCKVWLSVNCPSGGPDEI